MAAGVPAGTNTPVMVSASWSLMPISSSVGMFGSVSSRFLSVMPSARILPSLMRATELPIAPHEIGTWPPSSDCVIGPPPANGTGTKLTLRSCLSCSISKATSSPCRSPAAGSGEHTSEPPSQHGLRFPPFFFNDTATTEIYTLSLHDALPIFLDEGDRVADCAARDRHMAAEQRLRHWPAAGERHGDEVDLEIVLELLDLKVNFVTVPFAGGGIGRAHL